LRETMITTYIGVRVEIASRIIKLDPDVVIKKFNNQGDSRIFNLYVDGKITIERRKSLIIARGEKEKKHTKPGGMTNFSVMLPIDQKEIERIVQIVNVLGNGKLIRERVKTVVDGGSVLTKIPEMHDLIGAFLDIENLVPGLELGGWCYAPEASWIEK